jgi:hypothetical protein
VWLAHREQYTRGADAGGAGTPDDQQVVADGRGRDLVNRWRQDATVRRAAFDAASTAVGPLVKLNELELERARATERQPPARPDSLGPEDPPWLPPDDDADPPWETLDGEFAKAVGADDPRAAVEAIIASVRRRQDDLGVRGPVDRASGLAKDLAHVARAMVKALSAVRAAGPRAGGDDLLQAAVACRASPALGRLTALRVPLADESNEPVLQLGLVLAECLQLMAECSAASIDAVTERLDPRHRYPDVRLRELTILALDAAGVDGDGIIAVLRKMLPGEFERYDRPRDELRQDERRANAEFKRDRVDDLLGKAEKRRCFLAALAWAQESIHDPADPDHPLDERDLESRRTPGQTLENVRAVLAARRQRYDAAIARCRDRQTGGRGRRKFPAGT